MCRAYYLQYAREKTVSVPQKNSLKTIVDKGQQGKLNHKIYTNKMFSNLLGKLKDNYKIYTYIHT